MKEEVKRILKMVEEKKITAEEGERLIEELDGANTPAVYDAHEGGRKARFLRIHVVDEKDKVDVKIPISLIKVGLKLGKKFSVGNQQAEDVMKDIDIDQVMEAINEGATGPFVEINSESGALVEIYAE